MKKLISLFALAAVVGFISCDTIGPEDPDPANSSGSDNPIMDFIRDRTTPEDGKHVTDVDTDVDVGVGVGDTVEVNTHEKVNVDVLDAADVDVERKVKVKVDGKETLKGILELVEKHKLDEKVKSRKKLNLLDKIRLKKCPNNCCTDDCEDEEDTDVPGA